MKFIDPKIVKLSLALAWPISLQSVMTNSLSMIDVAMVSHLGDAAVSAVGLSNRFQFVILGILLGIAWTVGVLSAQFYGANKIGKIRSTIGMACILAHIALLPIILFNLFFADSIIGWASTDAETIKLGQHYLWIIIPSLSFVAVVLILENAIRGLGQVKTPMMLSLCAISINIILNFWLINGGLGVPPLGVMGAAIATVIARTIHVGLMLTILYQRKHVLWFKRADFQHLLDLEQVQHFLKLAMPMMISFGVWSCGTFVYQVIYGQLGSRELAVMSILTPIESIFIALFFGMSSACSITVGQHLGANRFDDAWQCARTYAFLNPIAAFGVGLIIFLSRDFILMPFSGLPAETLAAAETVFIFITLTAWIKVINMTLAMGVLRAGGETKACMYIDVIGMWIISIPLTLIAALYLKWPLIFVVMVAYSEELCKVALFVWRIKKKHWLRNLTINKSKQPGLSAKV
ncbi:MAG: putative MATE family efflux protein [Flavobacteriales bacterium]|jgi:putative MATE family efflux protein